MTIRITEEPLENFLEQIKPILHQHYDEIDHYFGRHMDLHPDYEQYEMYDQAETLRSFIARRDHDQKIVGYALYLVHKHPHYHTKTFATNDMIYVDKRYRKHGLAKDIINYAENTIMADFATLSMKAGHEFRELMESLGYEYLEITYIKKMG